MSRLRNHVPVLVGASVLGAALLAFPCMSQADDESATVGDVIVENVAATPAPPGETAKITFSVENSGTDVATITGVVLPSGEPSRVMGFLGHTGHVGEIGSIRVASGETVRVDGKTLWIDIGPLKEGLAPGAVLSARLRFATYDAPLSVHVSSPLARAGLGQHERASGKSGADAVPPRRRC